MSETSSASEQQEVLDQSANAEELDDLKKAFTLFDPDNDGFINPGKLFTCMRTLGYNPTEAEVQDMILAVDTNGTGQISFDDFVIVMTHRMRSVSTEDNIRQVFNAFDTDRNGSITDDDVKMLFQRLGNEKIISEDMPVVMKTAEIGATSAVSFQEFRQFIKETE